MAVDEEGDDDAGRRKYRKLPHGALKLASAVVVPKENDLLRVDDDSDMLSVWLSIVGAGLAVKGVDAPRGAPTVRYASAVRMAPVTLQFTPRFKRKHPSLADRFRALARQPGSVWTEASAPAATRGATPSKKKAPVVVVVDDRSDFRQWLVSVRRMETAVGAPRAVGPRRTRYGTAR